MKKTIKSKARKVYLRKTQMIKILEITSSVLISIIFLILWEMLSNREIISSFFFSSPSKIITTTYKMILSRELLYHSKITFYETMMGFIIATSIGFALAFIFWSFEFLHKIFEPYLVILNSLPKIALGPIIIIWFGAGQKAIVVMCVLIVVIVTTMNILNSFTNCDHQLISLAKSMGASKLQIFVKLILPNSLKDIISTLKINVGLSWIGAIMGEYLVSKAGLGYLLIYGGQVFDLNLVLTATFCLCLLASGMYFLVAIFEKILNKFYK